MSPAVKNILILNVIFFFAQWALPQIMPSLMLFPFSSENFEPWQLATHFFHAWWNWAFILQHVCTCNLWK